MQYTYDIMARIATLSVSGLNENFEKQVNIISWNGGDPVVDIRIWDTESGKCGKPRTIKRDEIPALIDALHAADIWFSSGEIDNIPRHPPRGDSEEQ